MASNSTDSGWFQVHGGDPTVASSGAYPDIGMKFTITFTRESGQQKVTWATSNTDDWLPDYGKYGFELFVYVAVNPSNPSNPSYDELWTILSKDNYTAENWWTTVDIYNRGYPTDTGCYINTTESTANVYVYVSSDCTSGNDGHLCYGSPEFRYYCIHSFTATVPTYEQKYDVIYDANGGVGEPEPQKKSSLSDLTLSEDEPTFPLSITYHNSPDDVRSVSKTFLNWKAYDTRTYDEYSYKADGDGTTTTFPRSVRGFNPPASEIKGVNVDGHKVAFYQFEDNHVTLSTPPRTGTNNVVIGFKSYPSYSGEIGTYSPGDTYSENKDAYMVAQWGSASFDPIPLPTLYVPITFNFNSGTGSPSSKSVARASLGYDTTQASTSYPYVPGTTATTTTDLDLYPKYGNATLPYNQLPTPTREGYSFTGWYRDAQLTDLIPAGTDIVTSTDMTIYAGWSALPLHQFTSGGDWGSIGPYVWQFGSDNQWHKVAHVYKFDGTNWVDLSDT